MIQENIKHAKIHLFGEDGLKLFKLYEDIILKALDSDKLSSFYAAYSREKTKSLCPGSHRQTVQNGHPSPVKKGNHYDLRLFSHGKRYTQQA